MIIALFLDDLYKNSVNFEINLGWGSLNHKEQNEWEWAKLRERERESEFGAKQICVNNQMVIKFRFVAFAEICLLVDKTNRTDKFRIKQIEQINLDLNK